MSASEPPPATKAATEPQPQPTSAAPQPVQPDRTVELEAIYFDFDKAVLRVNAVAALDRITAILRANPGSVILIEGHADERGTDTYNDRLGQKRAAAAHAYLQKLGLDTSRLQTVSRGEKQPADPDRSDTAYAHNRRVEFRLQGGGPLRPPRN